MPLLKMHITATGLAVLSALALSSPGHSQSAPGGGPSPINPNVFAPAISPQVLNKLKDIRQAQELAQHLKRMKYVKPLIRLPIPPRPSGAAASNKLR